MRPRFMNRGSANAVQDLRLRTRGFNEAPIHESGKYSCASWAGVTVRWASMRPRFMNRGSEFLFVATERF